MADEKYWLWSRSIRLGRVMPLAGSLHGPFTSIASAIQVADTFITGKNPQVEVLITGLEDAMAYPLYVFRGTGGTVNG